MPRALDIIKREHRNLGAVISCLDRLTRDIDDGRAVRDYRLFHAILNYIDGFLDRFHHPKEDRFLFPALVERCPDAAGAVEALEQEHVRGAELAKELRIALAACEYEGERAWPRFRDLAHEYAEFERRHAFREEREILPLALEHLGDDDWKAIDAAFTDHDDPVFGDDPRSEFASLHAVVTRLAPAPFGLAEPWDGKRDGG